MRKLATLALLTTLLLTAAAQAQSDTTHITITTQLVLLDALVETRQTHSPIDNLTAANFQLSEDVIPQPITFFGHDNTLPLSIVLLFDLTDTVRPTLKPLAKASIEFLAHLKPEDEVAIMVFSSHTELLQDFTTDRVRAVMAIDQAASMESNEGAFIHESMYEAITQATRATIPNSRRVLVWLTDGTANAETPFTRKMIGRSAPIDLHSEQESMDKLHRTGVVVAALEEKSNLTDHATALGGTHYGDIARYAAITGGPVLQSSKKEIANRLADLLDQLTGRYTLGFKPTIPKSPGTFCTLHLQLTPETFQQHPTLTPNNITISTREGYFR